MRSRVRHELRCWPEFFVATRRGHKKFELRRDDRPEGFQVGDELLLKEWDPIFETVAAPLWAGDGPNQPCSRRKGYTGRELLVRVDYVMPIEVVDKLMDLKIPYPAEHVIMSVSLVS